jgi:hypothetical protein
MASSKRQKIGQLGGPLCILAAAAAATAQFEDAAAVRFDGIFDKMRQESEQEIAGLERQFLERFIPATEVEQQHVERVMPEELEQQTEALPISLQSLECLLSCK